MEKNCYNVTAQQLTDARQNAGLTQVQASKLVHVTPLTWRIWEGTTSRTTRIPYAHWMLFVLMTGQTSDYKLTDAQGKTYWSAHKPTPDK